MNNNKQTAVEWLVSQLNKQGFAQVVTDEEIQQAKEMEKQQIIKSKIETLIAYEVPIETAKKFAEQDYNEEYRKL